MDAIEFFQAIEGGAEYRVGDINRLVEDEYERDNAHRMFADFVCASGKGHLLSPPPDDGIPIGDRYNPGQPRHPKGHPKGGQWVEAGGAVGGTGGGTETRTPEQARADEIDRLRRAINEAPTDFEEERARQALENFVTGQPPPPPIPDEIRRMTNSELDAEFDRINTLLENGGPPPEGTYLQLNAVANEMDRRKSDLREAELENLRTLTEEQLSEENDFWRQRYRDETLSREERIHAQRMIDKADMISSKRRSLRERKLREAAQLRIANEELTAFEEMSREELQSAYTEANNVMQFAVENHAEHDENYFLIEARRNALQSELLTRRRIEQIGNTHSSDLERMISLGNPREVEAAQIELNKRHEEMIPVKQAIATDFDNSKDLILNTFEKGSIPEKWNDDEEDYNELSGAAKIFEEAGYSPADVVKPFMPKRFYEDDLLDRTRHSIEVSDYSVSVTVSTRGGRIRRIFSGDEYGDLIVSHDLFQLSDDMQGGGISQEIMANSIREYEKMGVSRIDLHANIDAGGYVWARYGFVPTDGSWYDLKNNLSAYVAEDDDVWPLLQSDDPKAIWALADSPKGKRLLANSDWYGELNLSDDEAVSRFKNYANKGKKK